MKQFQYTNDRGTFGPYDEAKVRDFRDDVQRGLRELEVGQSWMDSEGDVWTLVPGSTDEPIVVTDQTARDERLERIATAVLAAIVGAVLGRPENASAVSAQAAIRKVPTEALAAEEAVGFAKALIAELDKQA